MDWGWLLVVGIQESTADKVGLAYGYGLNE